MARRTTRALPDDELQPDPRADAGLTHAAAPVLETNPVAVRDAYRLHRARRQARVEHRRRTKRAGVRFWVTLILLLVVSVVLAVTIWHEVQQLFGL